MRKPTGSWLDTLRRLGLRSTSSRRRSALRTTRLTGELLETRALLATVDLYGSSSVTEGSQADYAVVISPTQSSDTVINYQTTAGTAGSTDFSAVTSAVTIYAGNTSANFSVYTQSDSLDEDDESFTVTVSDPYSTLSFSVGASAVATTTINDDDDQPTISVADDAQTEGSTAHLTLTLSAESGRNVSVQYSYGGGGNATPGVDFTTAAGTVVFSPGETTKVIDFATTGDSIDELDETFQISLSNAVSASLADGNADVTIYDNDTAVISLSGGGSIAETGGTATFTFTLTGEADRALNYEYGTTDAGDIGSGDYAGTASGGTFYPGGGTTAIVTVAASSDTRDEDNETFSLTLTSSDAGLGTSIATATITDDDAPPTISIDYAGGVTEGLGSSLTFQVSLSSESGKTVVVSYGTGNLTAHSADYSSQNGTLTLSPGSTSESVTILVNDDSVDENDEVFAVTLSNAFSATLGTSIGLGTIYDNDDAPYASIIFDASAVEGGEVGFSISLSGETERDITVTYSASYGTAGAADFDASPGTIVVGSGGYIYIPTTHDLSDEEDETFSLSWGVSNGAIGSGGATGIILDNDDPPAVNVFGGMTIEGEDAVFTFAPATVSGKDITVYYQAHDGSATVIDGDYTSVSYGSAVIAADAANVTATVATTDESEDEDDETFSLVITGVSVGVSATAGVVGPQSVGVMTIIDADSYFSIAGGDSVAEPDEEGTTTTLEFVITFVDPGENGGSVNWRADIPYPAPSGYAGDEDIFAAEGLAEFPAGGGNVTVSVPVVFDTMTEIDELVTVYLYNPSAGSSVDTAEATGTIEDTPHEEPFSAGISVEPLAGVVEGDTITISGMVSVSEGDYPEEVTITNATFDEELGVAEVSSSDGFFALEYVFSDDADLSTPHLAANTYELVFSTTIDSEITEETVSVTVSNAGPTAHFDVYTDDGLSNLLEEELTLVGGENTPDDDGWVFLPYPSITDRGAGDFTSHTIIIDWGDGNSPVTLSPLAWDAFDPPQEHHYADIGADSDEEYEITVTVRDDDGGESSQKKPFTAVQGSPASGTTVSITGSIDSSADEVLSDDPGLRNTGSFTISRTGATTNKLVVRLDTGGDANFGPDYILKDGDTPIYGGIGYALVTIPAGQPSLTVTLHARSDSVNDPNEQAVFTIESYSFLYTTPYSIGVDKTATIDIFDGYGKVTFETVKSTVAEDVNTLKGWFSTRQGLEFKATLWGGTTANLPVAISGAGSSPAGTDDYISVSNVALTTGSGGTTTGVFRVPPVADLKAEDDETLRVTLGTSSVVSTHTASPSATGTILDDDSSRNLTVQVNFVPPPGSSAWSTPSSTQDTPEGTTPVGTFFYIRARREHFTNAPAQTISWRFSGDADFGADFYHIDYGGLSDTFDAGSEYSHGKQVWVRNDESPEEDEQYTITVLPSNSTEGISGQADFRIPKNDNALPLGVVKVDQSPFKPVLYYDWTWTGLEWARTKAVREFEPVASLATVKNVNEAVPGNYPVNWQSQSEYAETVSLNSVNIPNIGSLSYSTQVNHGGSSGASTLLASDGYPQLPGYYYAISTYKVKVRVVLETSSRPQNSPPDPGKDGDIDVERQTEVPWIQYAFRYQYQAGAEWILYKMPE